MDGITALRHVFGFVATPVLVGLLAGLATRLVWRRRLAGVSWTRGLVWPIGGAVAAQLAGLIAFGQDGRTATYAGVVVAVALALWWSALRGDAGGG